MFDAFATEYEASKADVLFQQCPADHVQPVVFVLDVEFMHEPECMVAVPLPGDEGLELADTVRCLIGYTRDLRAAASA